jgi:hypothetical protein
MSSKSNNSNSNFIPPSPSLSINQKLRNNLKKSIEKTLKEPLSIEIESIEKNLLEGQEEGTQLTSSNKVNLEDYVRYKYKLYYSTSHPIQLHIVNQSDSYKQYPNGYWSSFIEKPIYASSNYNLENTIKKALQRINNPILTINNFYLIKINYEKILKIKYIDELIKFSIKN